MKVKEHVESLLPGWRSEWRTLVKEHGDKKVSEVNVKAFFSGMRGVKIVPCDTSEVPPDKGMTVRGHMLKDIVARGTSPEELFYLMITGEWPDAEGVADIKAQFNARSVVPDYVWAVLDAMPADAHPMNMFSMGILALERESVFRKRYDEGMKKEDYWDATLEDGMDVLAKLPAIAAYIYRKRFNKGPRIEPDLNEDWAGNYVHMMGLGGDVDTFKDLMRMYLVLHSDHEGGNVSAHTTATVSSALSDMYYALSAGMDGLAGPLHGLANQECLGWVLGVVEKFGGVPSKADLEKYAWDTLNSGKVVPGYGHAVLRVVDPRYEEFLKWGKSHIKNDPVFDTVALVFDVVPDVLRQVKKISDPWPNVDAGSGALLYHFGLKEFPYYTVLFGVSRALGVVSQAIEARAKGYPIIRPKSIPTSKLKEIIGL